MTGKRVEVVILVVAVSVIMCGCRTAYEHRTFERETDPLQVDGFTITPSLSATALDKIGRRTGGPWRIKLVAKGGSHGSLLKVERITITIGGGAPESVDCHDIPLFRFHSSDAGDLGYLNVVLDKAVDVSFRDGLDVLLDLELTIEDVDRSVKARRTFRFRAKTERGETSFNPIFDIT